MARFSDYVAKLEQGGGEGGNLPSQRCEALFIL